VSLTSSCTPAGVHQQDLPHHPSWAGSGLLLHDTQFTGRVSATPIYAATLAACSTWSAMATAFAGHGAFHLLDG